MGLGAVRELVLERACGGMSTPGRGTVCKSVKGCTESWGLHGWKVGLGRGGMEERTLERYIESEP